MKKEYFDFLCFPFCNNELILNAFDQFNGKAKTGTLVCKIKKNSLIFKIENFIPRFVRSPKYAYSYCLQWNKFSQTHIDNILNNQFIKKFGLDKSKVNELLLSCKRKKPRSKFLIWKIY